MKEVEEIVPDAQKIVRDIICSLRCSSDITAVFDMAIEELTKLLGADRGVIWRIVDEQLVVTNQYARNEHQQDCARLGPQETAAIVSEFLTHRTNINFTVEVIAIGDTSKDDKWSRVTPTLAPFIQLGDARSRLLGQMQARGTFHGFVELQQFGTREWTEKDAAALQSVAELLAVVTQQSSEFIKMQQCIDEMKLVNDISSIFHEVGWQALQLTAEHAIGHVANCTGFACAQVFLLSHDVLSDDEAVLIPQTSEKEHSEIIPLSEKGNPFVQVFETPKLQLINLDFSKRKDAFFGHDTAMIIPLTSQGEKLGVLGLWRRKQESPRFRPRDKELALAVVPHLASMIRAEQAYIQLRQKGARESLLNIVYEQIQPLNEVNPMLLILVTQLAAYFDLRLAAVSIFDSSTLQFMEPQCAGSLFQERHDSKLAENLFQSQLAHLCKSEFLRQTTPTLILDPENFRKTVGEMAIQPESVKIIMMFPMRQGFNLKGALCLVSAQEKLPSLPDMRMIQDLVNCVAGAIEQNEQHDGLVRYKEQQSDRVGK